MAKKQLGLVLFAALFTGCFSQMMTKPVYDSIPLGTSIQSVEESAGPPYKIEQGQNGFSYYRYIERIEIGPGEMAHKTYVLTVANGIVIDKQALDSGSGVTFSTPR